MIIKSVELVNYRQHEHIKVEFDGNLIGVLGRNGSGKSHFMHAIEFAFASKVGGQNKSDMLRWGAAEGSVTVVFEHNGATGRIYRELHSTKATFTYGDEKPVSGISKVNETIAEKTGLDPDICKQAVFVHQKDVDAVLFTEPSVRQLAWQRLCGLGDASKTHSKLGQFLAMLPGVEDYSERINEALERVEEAEEALTTAQENFVLTEMSGLDPAQIEEQTQKVRQLKAAIDSGIRQSEELGRTQMRLHELNQELHKIADELSNYLDDPEECLKQVTARVNEAVASLAAIERAAAFTKQLNDVQTRIDSLVCRISEEELAAIDSAVGEGRTALTRARAKHELNAELLKAVQKVSEESVCPLCTQPVSGDIKELATKAAEASSAEVVRTDTRYRELTALLQEATNERMQYAGSKAMLEQNKAKLAGQLDEAKQLITMQTTREEVQFLQTEASKQQATVTAKRSQEMRHKACSAQISTLSEEVTRRSKEVEATLTTATELIKATGISNPAAEIATRLDDLRKDAEMVRAVREETARLTGQITEMEKSLENLNDTIVKLRDRESKQASLKAVVDTLAAVRKWFHYEEGPQVVVNSLLEQITSGVNDFLDKFGAPFYAIPDFGTTSFRYCYTDDRPMPEEGYPPISEMSGGEAMVLAVSFRFATYCLFASRIGLLTLDEPTVYLDDTNIGCFCNLLNRMKELAADMHLQILISTHEEVVLPFMDSTIKFNTYQTEETDDDREEQ